MRNVLLRAGMQFYRERHWRPMERAADRPGHAQRETLRRLLLANRDTHFGTTHGFADIAGPSQFRERVPVQDYEMLRPFIEEQRRTGARALTVEAPLFYAQTSGSTGTPKYIPITPALNLTPEAATIYRQPDTVAQVHVAATVAAVPQRSQPRPEPAYPSPGPEAAYEEIDWTAVVLGLLALLMVGGLVPFWIYIYFLYNPR
jgi:hypothetical protein